MTLLAVVVRDPIHLYLDGNVLHITFGMWNLEAAIMASTVPYHDANIPVTVGTPSV